jgi:hypothetical protein
MVCRQQRRAFRTELRYFTTEVDGKSISFLEPRAYCLDCGEEIWVDGYDEMHVRNYEEAVEKMREVRNNGFADRKTD